MGFELRLAYELRCDFCNQAEGDHESAVYAALFGATKYANCPQCKNFVSKERAVSPEWREEMDKFEKERREI